MPPFHPSLTIEEIQAVFPDLKVRQKLGEGGQGDAFLCTRSDESVAVLKIYGPDTEDRRVSREFEKLQRVSSPYVVKLFDSGQVSLRGKPVFFGLMEWIDGADLATTPIPMTEQDVWALIRQVATGVGALSEQSVVHRDIKPENIVRRANGDFVLIDLGYAKHLDRSTLTQKNHTCGTEGYIAPELMMGFRPTFRADLFSLGVVAYLMASGNHPYRGLQDLVGKITVLPIQAVSDDLNAIILRLLCLRPSDRARSWEDLREARGR